MVLQLTADYGGKATVNELEKRFSEHKEIKASGIGFPGDIHFYSPYCEQRGNPQQKAEMAKILRQKHINIWQKHIERCCDMIGLKTSAAAAATLVFSFLKKNNYYFLDDNKDI